MHPGDWDRALGAYQEAAEADPTPDATAAVAQAQRSISDREQAKQRAYSSAMGEARSAIQAGNWAKATDAFTRAAATKDTTEARNGIATSRRKMASAQPSR